MGRAGQLKPALIKRIRGVVAVRRTTQAKQMYCTTPKEEAIRDERKNVNTIGEEMAVDYEY